MVQNIRGSDVNMLRLMSETAHVSSEQSDTRVTFQKCSCVYERIGVGWEHNKEVSVIGNYASVYSKNTQTNKHSV